MAAILTVALVQLRGAIDRADATDPPPIAKGEHVPDIAGVTLDGGTLSLADLRGHPVIINFWGPGCVPCRDEFPLFKSLLAAHEADGLMIVGVLMDDPPAPAREFIAQYGATWPTVDDPDKAIRNAYRVAARPQSYFVDWDGVLRSIQVGELTQAEFDRQYVLISNSGPAPMSTPVTTPPTTP